MTLDEILNKEGYHYRDIQQFVAQKGIKNIKTADLDKMIKKFDGQIMSAVDFVNLYNIVSSDETNKTMKAWTITTGILTIIVTIATVINVILFAGTLK